MFGDWFINFSLGTQRGDGLFGALIIRQPKSREIHSGLYDLDLPEHVIIITDWMHESGAVKFAAHYHSIGTNKPDTILVNGLRSSEFRAKNGSSYFTPMASFEVTQVTFTIFSSKSQLFRSKFLWSSWLHRGLHLSWCAENSDTGGWKF